MGWISARKQDEQARDIREQLSSMYEKELGRKLTPKELKAVSDDAAKTAAVIGRRARGEDY